MWCYSGGKYSKSLLWRVSHFKITSSKCSKCTQNEKWWSTFVLWKMFAMFWPLVWGYVAINSSVSASWDSTSELSDLVTVFTRSYKNVFHESPDWVRDISLRVWKASLIHWPHRADLGIPLKPRDPLPLTGVSVCGRTIYKRLHFEQFGTYHICSHNRRFRMSEVSALREFTVLFKTLKECSEPQFGSIPKLTFNNVKSGKDYLWTWI